MGVYVRAYGFVLVGYSFCLCTFLFIFATQTHSLPNDADSDYQITYLLLTKFTYCWPRGGARTKGIYKKLPSRIRCAPTSMNTFLYPERETTEYSTGWESPGTCKQISQPMKRNDVSAWVFE